MSAKPVRTIAAGEFKAKCLAILDEVGAGGGEVVVTKHGKPVAKVVPLKKPAVRRRANLAHLVEFVGDIETPVDVEWKAMR